jgi:hypothetical protein
VSTLESNSCTTVCSLRGTPNDFLLKRKKCKYVIQ